MKWILLIGLLLLTGCAPDPYVYYVNDVVDNNTLNFSYNDSHIPEPAYYFDMERNSSFGERTGAQSNCYELFVNYTNGLNPFLDNMTTEEKRCFDAINALFHTQNPYENISLREYEGRIDR